MSESVVLRDELERMEARIAELRKLKLGVEARRGEIEKEERRLEEDIGTMEKMARLLRGVLAKPDTGAPGAEQLPAPRLIHEGSSPIEIVRTLPTKVMLRAGSKRDQVLSVLRNMEQEQGGPVRRKEILKKCIELDVMGHERDPDTALTNILHYLKHSGIAASDNRGNWETVDWNRIGRNTKPMAVES